MARLRCQIREHAYPRHLAVVHHLNTVSFIGSSIVHVEIDLPVIRDSTHIEELWSSRVNHALAGLEFWGEYAAAGPMRS